MQTNLSIVRNTLMRAVVKFSCDDANIRLSNVAETHGEKHR